MPHKIECTCGNLVDVDIYDSVNVTVDPSLLDKIKHKQINNFKCSKCGTESELSYQFLFVDLLNKLWVWCYPEGQKENRLDIENETINNINVKHMTDAVGIKPVLVFGYNELLEMIISK